MNELNVKSKLSENIVVYNTKLSSQSNPIH